MPPPDHAASSNIPSYVREKASRERNPERILLDTVSYYRTARPMQARGTCARAACLPSHKVSLQIISPTKGSAKPTSAIRTKTLDRLLLWSRSDDRFSG